MSHNNLPKFGQTHLMDEHVSTYKRDQTATQHAACRDCILGEGNLNDE